MKANFGYKTMPPPPLTSIFNVSIKIKALNIVTSVSFLKAVKIAPIFPLSGEHTTVSTVRPGFPVQIDLFIFFRTVPCGVRGVVCIAGRTSVLLKEFASLFFRYSITFRFGFVVRRWCYGLCTWW